MTNPEIHDIAKNLEAALQAAIEAGIVYTVDPGNRNRLKVVVGVDHFGIDGTKEGNKLISVLSVRDCRTD